MNHITITEEMAYILIEHYASLNFQHLRVHGVVDDTAQEVLESLILQTTNTQHVMNILEGQRNKHFETIDLVEVYVDGSVKHNNEQPKLRNSGIAAAIYVNNELQRIRVRATGNRTSTETEYLALKLALDNLMQMGLQHQHVIIYSDAEGVINQVNMIHRTKAKHIVAMRDSIRYMMGHFDNIELTYIPSESNVLCDTLSKDIIEDPSEDESLFDLG